MNPQTVWWWNPNIINRSFFRVCRATLIAVYVLILVGGIVRSTGSGMGCPDWPKCFGEWVPPRSVEELPSDYKQLYSDYRNKKNVKFAQYLRAFGMQETADRLLKDESVQKESDFNVAKTWTEYFNRVVGVVIGFLIFLTFIVSCGYWKTRRWIPVMAFFTFVLVGFQGWIGSVVVSTNLTPWTITLHMILALAIVCLLVLLMESTLPKNNAKAPSQFIWLTGLCLVLLFIQIVWGTQVREAIDSVGARLQSRSQWIGALGWEFVRHRSFSWVVLIVNCAFVIKLWKSGSLSALSVTLIVLILGTILSGIGMAFFAIPPFLQPVHLLLATGAFGIQFIVLVRRIRFSTIVKNDI